MKRVLCTYAKGDYQELLELTAPAMAQYARRHGYQFLDCSEWSLRSLVRELGWSDVELRPWSWYKVPLLFLLLKTFRADEVLWLDADALIVDPSEDLAGEVPATCAQALVYYRRASAPGKETARGPVAIEPGTGQWLVRSRMVEELSKFWRASSTFIDVPCHEQSALVCALGGVADGRSMGPGPYTELHSLTCQLDHRWGAQRWELEQAVRPAIRHAVGGSVAERKAVIKAWLQSSKTG